MIKGDFEMENIKVKDRFVDEKTGIEYIKQGDYYLPNLVLAPEETSYTIGKYEIQNINDVTKIKNELTENMNNLKENKKQLLKKYIKAEDIDKEKIKTKIENITFGISKISKEIQTCRKIINNTERGEKEQKLIEQREKENLNINHKNIKKEKFRIK